MSTKQPPPKHRVVRLVEALLEKSQAGVLSWERTITAERFTVSYPNYTIASYQYDEADNPDSVGFGLTINDADGRVVENITGTDLVEHGKMSYAAAVKTLQGIFLAARRKAMGADEAMDALIKQLEDELPF
jgi:hypothetical protein